ncbi:hypothetical protein GQ600_6980 [Phytophthora cactorum]|nr:hypothetical protein GQ600_6980 [Phytophthora cactorum]
MLDGLRADYARQIRELALLDSTLYSDEDCTDLMMGFGYPATGSCVGAYNESDSLYVIANLT